MKIAIIGGGFVGLAAAIELIDSDNEVVILEAEERLGGLAGGFKPKGWEWSLEKFYHHIFANDEAIKKIAEKVGWPADFFDPKTDTFKNGMIAELDSPIALLKYDQLSLYGRLRMALGLAILKVVMSPRLGMLFEKYKVVELLPELVGQDGYDKVWEPLMLAKFRGEVKNVNMAWFWARIVKRTKKLGYFPEGFEKLAMKMGEYVTKKGGEIRLGVRVGKIKTGGDKVEVDGEVFDRLILTVPAPLIEKMAGKIGVKVPRINYLWGQTLILELKQSLMKSYWLNILEKKWPFLVVVEQTRLIDKSKYGGKTVVYIGNYLEDGDLRLKMDEEGLMELFRPYLVKINPEFKTSWISRMWKFQAPFAQPVLPINYSKQLPGMKTAMPGVYMANMSMVYPWDRGTNYAVELGIKVAKEVVKQVR